MLTVLLSDDNILVLNKLNMMLAEFKDCVVLGSAMDGVKTIELIQQRKPDLLIVDVKMPRPNGVEIAQYISRNKIATSIIALSDYDDYEYVRPIMRAGAVDYILKHELNFDMLEKKLEEVRSGIVRREDSAIRSRYYSLHAKQTVLLKLLTENEIDGAEKGIVSGEEEFSGTCHVIVCIQISDFAHLYRLDNIFIWNSRNISIHNRLNEREASTCD